MKWNDENITEKTNLPLSWLIFSFIGSAVGEYSAIQCLFLPGKNMPVIAKFLVLIFIVIVFLWLRYGVLLFIDGKSIIRNIIIDLDSVNFENALHFKINSSNNNIKCISDVESKWHTFKPHFYKSDKKGFTIFLKDGRFFRVSPHMERIDELKAELEHIIDENKQLDK